MSVAEEDAHRGNQACRAEIAGDVEEPDVFGGLEGLRD